MAIFALIDRVFVGVIDIFVAPVRMRFTIFGQRQTGPTEHMVMVQRGGRSLPDSFS
jgi:hypothetical protein